MCPPGAVKKYLNKISGPLLDRIDSHVEVTPVSYDQLSMQEKKEERSSRIVKRVVRARNIQEKRFAHLDNIFYNAQMPSSMVKKVCKLNDAGTQLLRNSMEKLQLSARAYDRILKVSRTVADLDGSTEIRIEHLAEAINYRSLDREDWAG